MMVGQHTGPKKYSKNFLGLDQMGTFVDETNTKKRRESIDIGHGIKRNNSSEALPFMRRKAPEEFKPETNHDDGTNGDGKAKNF